MTREIKFRAWQPEANAFWRLSLRPGESGGGCDLTGALPWEQFTGLKDSRGVEIYEGDILETWIPHGTRDLGVVEYRGSSFWRTHTPINKHDLPYCHIVGLQSIVIGNIHENPNSSRSSYEPGLAEPRKPILARLLQGLGHRPKWHLCEKDGRGFSYVLVEIDSHEAIARVTFMKHSTPRFGFGV